MKKLLIILVLLAVASGGFLVARADIREARHQEVDIAVDYNDVRALAREAAVSTAEMLARLQELGVTAVGLPEATVARYRDEGRLSVAEGSTLLNEARVAGTLHPRLAALLAEGKVLPGTVYLITDDLAFARELAEKAELRLARPVALYDDAEPFVVAVAAPLEQLEKLPLGPDRGDVEVLRSLGLRIVPRLNNCCLPDARAVEAALDDFFTLPKDAYSAVLFEGGEVTGFPGNIDVTAEYLREVGIPFGIVEYNPRNEGAFTLASLTDNSIVLAHSNWERENVQAIINSARERRVRLLYVRVYPADPDFYKKGTELIEGVAEKMAALGYRPGAARPFDTPEQEKFLLLLLLAGVAAAFTLLFFAVAEKFLLPPGAVFLLALAGLGAVFPLFGYNNALQAVSILAAMIFPLLAVITQQFKRLPREAKGGREALLWALAALVRTFLVTIAGGLVVLGLTSTPYFISGLPLFRGVKVMHTLPLLIVAAYAVIRLVYAHVKVGTRRELIAFGRQVLSRPVLFGHVLTFLVLAAAGYIYVGRTGHTAGIPVLDVEQQLRLLLGDALGVRPRFKEFLIGYPLALLGLLLLARGYRNLIVAALLTAGAIAFISVANTFMHFTTPGYITLLRSFNGLWLGVICGLVLAAVVCAAAKLGKRALK